MDYKLSNPKRKKIFQQFLYNKRLRFNEIEKLTAIRSNDLAYFLQKLVEEGTLRKEGEMYMLSDQAEKYIPFFVESEEKMSPLPVVLVACLDDGKVLLWKRNKRPYDGHWSLPGGRLRLGETVEKASLRVLKDITFVDGSFESVNAVVNERHAGDKLKHGFLIVFTKTSPLNSIKDKENVRWFDVSALPDGMIPSDKWLLQEKMGSRIELEEETIVDESGVLDIKME
ncbi:NUDIX domain-containing protein [Candidatus Woesearchaeota archaeon]|nr:NUDIX domain-containing protein [Candidatus Woesearchaeota archaeon]